MSKTAVRIKPVVNNSVTEDTRRNLFDFIDSEYAANRSKLPSEIDLAKALHVSRISLREVLKELQQEGVIYSVHGKGTFINCNYKKLKVKLTPAVEFEQAIGACGYIPSVSVLSLQLESPEERTAKELNLKPEDKVYSVSKVFFADGAPVIFCVDIFPQNLLNDSTLTVEEISRSTFDVLMEKANIRVDSDIVDVKANTSSALTAFGIYTQITPPIPLLELDSVYYTAQQLPVMKVNAYFDTRYIRLSMLRRQQVYKN